MAAMSSEYEFLFRPVKNVTHSISYENDDRPPPYSYVHPRQDQSYRCRYGPPPTERTPIERPCWVESSILEQNTAFPRSQSQPISQDRKISLSGPSYRSVYMLVTLWIHWSTLQPRGGKEGMGSRGALPRPPLLIPICHCIIRYKQIQWTTIHELFRWWEGPFRWSTVAHWVGKEILECHLRLKFERSGYAEDDS